MSSGFLRRDTRDARAGRNRAAYKEVRKAGYSKDLAREIAGQVRPKRGRKRK